MFARVSVLSFLASTFVGHVAGGLTLDVNSSDSLKSVAKTLAGGIINIYNDDLKESGTPGLFNAPYYFWEMGTVWNALIGYSHLTGDSQYDSIISEALQFQVGEFNAFMPANQTKSLGNDDQSCWGLAAMAAAEAGLQKPKSGEWVDLAVNVWNTQAARLDWEAGTNGTCGGGLRWQIFTFNAGYGFKNAWSNGNFFLLSARLAKFTGNSTYSRYADKSFQWAQTVGLITKDFKVYDGVQVTGGCKDISHIRWSAPHGLYTEGAALMHNITGNKTWTDATTGFVDASKVFQANSSSILIESACEDEDLCDIDQRAFKGVFSRSFARAAYYAPHVAANIKRIFVASAPIAAKTCEANDKNVTCTFGYVNPIEDAEGMEVTEDDPGLGEAFDALELVQGLLYSEAKTLRTSSSGTTGNATQTGSANGASGTPQGNGAVGSATVSLSAVLAVAIVAALNC